MIVAVVMPGFGSGRSSSGSACEACRISSKGRSAGTVFCETVGGGGDSSCAPGRKCRVNSDITTPPASLLKRVTRLICRFGPPTGPQGSQKL